MLSFAPATLKILSQLPFRPRSEAHEHPLSRTCSSKPSHPKYLQRNSSPPFTMIPTPEVPLRMPKSPSPTLGMSDHSQPLLYNMNFLSFARIASMSGHVQNSILLEIREANRVEFPLETLESWQDSHEGS